MENQQQDLRVKKTKVSKPRRTLDTKKLLRMAGIVGVGIVIVSTLLGIFVAPAISDAYSSAKMSQQHVTSVRNKIAASDFSGALIDVRSLQQSLEESNEALQRLGWLRWVPLVGRQIKAGERLTAAGVQVAAAGEAALDYVDEIATSIAQEKTVSFSSLSVQKKREILQKIVESPPILQRVKSNIDLAALALDETPKTFIIGPLKDVLDQLEEYVPAVQDGIEQYGPLLEVAPSLLGYPEQRTYLFLLQNNNELRPTGGFIGTYGIVKLKDAEVASFETDNVYNLDDNIKGTKINTKPWQLREYSDPYNTEWFMRDGNWSPDFPTASKDVLGLYKLEGGKEKVTGVIAIDPVVIAELLRLTGDLTIQKVTFTPDNLTDQLENEVGFAFQYKGISLADRKNIIGDMGDVLLERVLNYPREKLGDLSKVMLDLLNQKHILVYVNDETIEERIKEQPWGGAIQRTSTDYLYWVDANLAAKKTDQVMTRALSYSVAKEGSEYVATAAMTYTHGGISPKEINKVTRYQTYVRVYVPEGSELIQVDGSQRNSSSTQPSKIETNNEFGRTSFGFYTTVEPGKVKTVTVKYKLPPGVTEALSGVAEYSLFVQKQPGTHAHGLSVQLPIKKSEGASVSWGDLKQEGTTLTWSTNLLQNQSLTIPKL